MGTGQEAHLLLVFTTLDGSCREVERGGAADKQGHNCKRDVRQQKLRTLEARALQASTFAMIESNKLACFPP